MAAYLYCIYVHIYIYIIYMYIYIYDVYIYIGFREGYKKLNVFNFRTIQQLPTTFQHQTLRRTASFFIAAGARHGYATWRWVGGGDGAVTWLVLLNNTQLVGSWDM